MRKRNVFWLLLVVVEVVVVEVVARRSQVTLSVSNVSSNLVQEDGGNDELLSHWPW